ncbi:MAG TPA: hypothetical protein DCQ30_00275 [Acidimicrobiaceae bacterium]|nr:hypothetical protein [Acidimicrobiaceae bacterium]
MPAAGDPGPRRRDPPDPRAQRHRPRLRRSAGSGPVRRAPGHHRHRPQRRHRLRRPLRPRGAPGSNRVAPHGSRG